VSLLDLVLVRHGEAEGVEGRAVGHFDAPLSEAGAASISALAASWRGRRPDRLIASDLQRAAQSARLLADPLDAKVATDPRLRELCFGAWEGKTWDEIHRQDRRRLALWGRRWWEVAPPEGETFGDLSRRVLDWLSGQIEEGGLVVAVTHGGSLRALFGAVLGLPREQLLAMRFDVAHVSALAMTADDRRVLFHNRNRFQPVEMDAVAGPRAEPEGAG
jgi:broad specificity phosphatase PhoE